MASVEQGDLLKVEGIQMPVIVVSNNFFNQNGRDCQAFSLTAPLPIERRVNYIWPLMERSACSIRRLVM